MAVGPRTTGRGITASPRRTPLDNRLTLRVEWARETRAAAGSPAPWCTCQSVTESPGYRYIAGYRRPQARCRTRPDNQPTLWAVGTFDVCFNAAVNSDLSCFVYRGRLTRPYLHCRADSVARLWLSAHGGRNVCSLCPLPLSCCPLFHGVGVRVSGMRATAAVKQLASAERPVTIIPFTEGLLSGGRISLDSLKSRNSFPRDRKK